MDDPEKFLKFMRMTTSTVDAEVLVAIRKANEMLAADNMDWGEFLNSLAKQGERVVVYTEKPVEPRNDPSGFHMYGGKLKYTRKEDGAEIEKLFKHAFKRVRPAQGFYTFIKSVQQSYEYNDFITARQFEVLNNIR